MARVDLRVAGYSNYAFSNTNPGDLIFRLQNTGAAVHFGDSGDAMPALTVNRDSIAFNASNVVFGGDSKLGIGTSNPGYPFEVVGDVNITGTIFNNGVPFQGGSGGGGESVWDNSNGNIFVVGSNVGIGTTQPIADLHVVGTTKLDGTVVLPSLLSFTGISISSGNDSNEIQYTKEWHESSNGGVFIMGSNVGIGVNEPAFPLDVAGDINLTGRIRQNGLPYVGSQWSNTEGGEVFLMGSNVGIGVNEPAFPLDVAGDINLTGRIRQNGLPYVGSQWSNTEGGEVFLMGSNVGIGVSDPAYTLDVQGNARIGGLIVESNTLSLPGRLTFGGLKINQVDGIAGGSTNLSMTPQFIQSGCNLYLPSGCNLGLGVSNAVERLEVDGFISADGVKMAGTNYKLGLNVGGDKFDISYSNESLIDAKADIRYEISGTANNTPAILAQNTYGVVGELVRVNKNGDRFGLMPTYTGDVVRFANEHGSIDSNVTINTPTSSGFVITKRNSLGQLEWLWDAYPNISFSNCLYPGFGLGPIYCDNDGGVLSIIELTGGFDSTSRVVLTDVQNSQTTVEMIDNNFNFKSSQLLVHFDSDGRIINTCLFLDIDPVDFDKTFTQPKINGVVQLPNGNIIIASSYIKTIKTGTSLLTIDNMRSLTNIILGSNGSLTLWQTYSYNTELDQDTSDDVRIMLNYNCISLCDNGFVVLSPFEYSIDQNTSNVTKNINISDFNGNQRVFSFTESYNQCYGYILTKYDNNLNKLWESGYEVGIINFLGTYENEYPMISSIDGSITIHNSFEYQDDIAGPHDLNIYVNGVKTTYIIPDGTRGSTIVRFSSDGTFMWYYIPVVNHSNNYNYFARYYSIPASMMYKGDVFVFGRSIFYNEPSFIEHIGKNGKFIRFYDFAQIRGFAHANICDDDSLPLRLQILMYSFYIDFPSLTIGSYPPIKVTATQSQQLIELSLNLEERKFKTNSLNADTWIYGDVLNIADDSIQNTKIGISNALESVKHLEAFTYKRNDVLDGTTYIGFDSSNVQSFIPEVVREKGREKYISYNGILGVVTEAVKSLAGIVESNAATPGQWKNMGSNVFLMGSNVGVGVSNPMYALDVGGEIKATGVNFNGSSDNYVIQYGSASNLEISSSNVVINEIALDKKGIYPLNNVRPYYVSHSSPDGLYTEYVTCNSNGYRFSFLNKYGGSGTIKIARSNGSIDTDYESSPLADDGFIFTKKDSNGNLLWFWDSRVKISNDINAPYAYSLHCDNNDGVILIFSIKKAVEFTNSTSFTITDINNNTRIISLFDNPINNQISAIVHFDNTGTIINHIVIGNDQRPYYAVDYMTFGAMQLPNNDIIISCQHPKRVRTSIVNQTFNTETNQFESVNYLLLKPDSTVILWNKWYTTGSLGDEGFMKLYNNITKVDDGFIALFYGNTAGYKTSTFYNKVDSNIRTVTFPAITSSSYVMMLTKYDFNLQRVWESTFEIQNKAWMGGGYSSEYVIPSFEDGSIVMHFGGDLSNDQPSSPQQNHILNVYKEGINVNTFTVPYNSCKTIVVSFDRNGNFKWYYPVKETLLMNLNFITYYISTPNIVVYKGNTFIFTDTRIDMLDKNGKLIKKYTIAATRAMFTPSVITSDQLSPILLFASGYGNSSSSLTIDSTIPTLITGPSNSSIYQDVLFNMPEQVDGKFIVRGGQIIDGPTYTLADASVQSEKIGVSNALSNVLGLNAFRYQRKDIVDGNNLIGFDASNVATYIPEAVITDVNGKKYVSYDAVLGVVTEAVKSLAGVVGSNVPSQWKNVGSNVFLMGSNVGVGVSNPMYALDVGGVANFGEVLINGQNTIHITSNVAYGASNVAISASNRAFGSLALTGGTLSGTLTGTTINANTLQQGGTAVSSLFASLETSNVAYGASNVAISASNRAFGSLALTGGTLTGMLTGTTINANTLQQGGSNVSSLFAPLSHNHDASAITTGTLGVARGGTGATSLTANKLVVANTEGTAVTTPTGLHWDNVNIRLGVNTSAPIQALDVSGNIRVTGTILEGDSTDASSSRAISCLDSTMANGSTKSIAIGKANTARNQGSFIYNHVADGSTSNYITLALNSVPVLEMYGDASSIFKGNLNVQGNLTLGGFGPFKIRHGSLPTDSNGNITIIWSAGTWTQTPIVVATPFTTGTGALTTAHILSSSTSSTAFGITRQSGSSTVSAGINVNVNWIAMGI